MRICENILGFARSGNGDVVALQGEFAGSLHLSSGDCRVWITLDDDAMRSFGVRHRSRAYR